jgi:hypothetical protein
MALLVSRACWQAPLVKNQLVWMKDLRMNTCSLVDLFGLILRCEGPHPGIKTLEYENSAISRAENINSWPG